MFDFLASANLKTAEDGSVHFFPLSGRRGYRLDGAAEVRRVRRIYKLTFLGMVVAGTLGWFLRHSWWESVAVIGGLMASAIGHYVAVRRMIRGRATTGTELSRAESQRNFLRDQSYAFLVFIGVIGASAAAAGVYVAYRLAVLEASVIGKAELRVPFVSWLTGAPFLLLGLFIVVMYVRAIVKKRRLHAERGRE